MDELEFSWCTCECEFIIYTQGPVVGAGQGAAA